MPTVYIDSDRAHLLIAGMAGARLLHAAAQDPIAWNGLNRVAVIARLPAQDNDERSTPLRKELRRFGGVSLGIFENAEFIELSGHAPG